MVKLAEVYKRLAPAKNNNLLAVANQSTNDIINQVLSQHNQNAVEAKKICDLFYGGNLYETSRNIWNFLKYEVPYKVEPSDKQTTKTLSRMLFDAMNGKGNDCKHYAGFTGAVLDACGFTDWRYRFAGYSKYINVPTHVYCYAKDDDGMIYIDAVINGFDLEKPFVLNIDKKINNKNMSLYKLSGVDSIGDFWDNVKKPFKDAAKVVTQVVDKVADQVREGTKTVTLAIPRNAFLLLLKFNVHGWATGLKNQSWGQLGWWTTDWGGNRTDLVNAIKDGAKNKRILGFDYNDVIYPNMVNGIGEPVTIAAALASATPILIKITSILDEAQKVADKAEKLQTKAKSITDTVKDAKAGFEAITGKKVEEVLFKKDAGQTGDKNQITTADLKQTTAEDAQKVANALTGSKSSFKLDTKTMLLIGGAGVALLLILKKK